MHKHVIIFSCLALLLTGCHMHKEPVHDLTSEEKVALESEKDMKVKSLNTFSLDPKDYNDVKVTGADILRLIENYNDIDYGIFVYSEDMHEEGNSLTEIIPVRNYCTLAITAVSSGKYDCYVSTLDTDDSGRVSIIDYAIDAHMEHKYNNDIENAKKYINNNTEYRASVVYLGDSKDIAGIYFREIAGKEG